MNKTIKEKWVRALRSGKYKQSEGSLRLEDPGEFMGIDGDIQYQLAAMNDSGNLDFNQIADYIEEKL